MVKAVSPGQHWVSSETTIADFGEKVALTSHFTLNQRHQVGENGKIASSFKDSPQILISLGSKHFGHQTFVQDPFHQAPLVRERRRLFSFQVPTTLETMLWADRSWPFQGLARVTEECSEMPLPLHKDSKKKCHPWGSLRNHVPLALCQLKTHPPALAKRNQFFYANKLSLTIEKQSCNVNSV